jgi:hypothetical protein
LCVSELGLFENEYCFRCQQFVEDFPQQLFDIDCYDILSEIFPICRAQDFFQTLCTGIIECTLLGIIWNLRRCVYLYFHFGSD